jgi:hypothetical protein
MIEILDFNSGEADLHYSVGRDLPEVGKVDQRMISCVGRRVLSR